MTWYALVVSPRGEFHAGGELEAARVKHFVPYFTERVRAFRYMRAMPEQVVRALTPRYVFADIDVSARSHDLHAIDQCRHIVDMVTTPSGIPRPARPEQIAELKALCDMGAFDIGRQRGRDYRFVNGARVRITQGSWAGTVATYRATGDDGLHVPRMGFVKVILDAMFGSAGFAMDVPQELLEAA